MCKNHHPILQMTTVPSQSEGAAYAMFARSAKQAKFAMLAASDQMSRLEPNLRSNCISAAAIAALILKKYEIPFRVVAGYTTVDGDPHARPHVWLHTAGLPAGDGITDLAAIDDRKQTPMLGQYMFVAEDSRRCRYWEGPHIPEGFTEGPKAISVAVLASHSANFDMYFYRGSDALRAARDKTLEHAYSVATEKIGASDRAERDAQWGGSIGPGMTHASAGAGAGAGAGSSVGSSAESKPSGL